MSETVAAQAVDTSTADVPAEALENNSTENSGEKQQQQESFKPIKLKLKLDKKEEEMEFDQDRLTRTVQKGIVADRRFEEAARKEQEVKKMMSEIEDRYSRLSDKQFLKKILQEQGVDHLQLAEEYLLEHLQEASLTQEERKIRELEMFKEKKEREEQELLEQFQRRQKDEEIKKHYTQLDQEISASLEKHGIEKNLSTVERILQYLRAAERSGIALDVEEVVERLSSEWQSYNRSHLVTKSAEELERLLGEEKIKEIISYNVRKKAGNRTPVQIVSKQATQQKVTDPYLFFKNLGR